MKKTFLLALIIAFSGMLQGKDPNRVSRQEYIAMYKQDAVKDMQLTGVPASITLAQAILESDDGNSPLAKEANNHFGIKCANWNGPGFYQDDDSKGECFRKYNSVLESYDDHSDFLRTRSRYAFLFELDRTDYKGWAKGLKKAGYATNPQYANLLIKIIEDNNLHELDNGNPLPPLASVRKEDRMANVSSSGKRNANELTVDPFRDRQVLVNNKVKYVTARKGDTYKKISDEMGMAPWEIYKYNDADKSDVLTEGQIVYIKPKRNKGSDKYYTVNEGETVYSVSMKLGIKSKSLCKFNGLHIDTPLQPGTVLWLQTKKPS
jgi:LysM repeat protein